nr:unnamed protein product [Naegleria fowleri]
MSHHATASTTTATNIIGASSSLSSSLGGDHNLSQQATILNNNNGSNSGHSFSSVLAPPNGTQNTNLTNYHLNSQQNNSSSNGSLPSKSNLSAASNNHGFTNNNNTMLTSTSNVYHHCLNPASNPRISSPPPQVPSSGLSHQSPTSMNSPPIQLNNNNTGHIQNGGPAISCNNNNTSGVITGSTYSLNHNTNHQVSVNNSNGLPSNFSTPMGNSVFGTTNHHPSPSPSPPSHHHFTPNNASNNNITNGGSMMMSGAGHSQYYQSVPNPQHLITVNGGNTTSTSHPIATMLSNQNLPNLGHSEQPHSSSPASSSSHHHSPQNYHGGDATTFPFSGTGGGVNPSLNTSSPLHTLHHQMASSAFPNTAAGANQQQITTSSIPSPLASSSLNSPHHHSQYHHQVNNMQGSVAATPSNNNNNTMMTLSPSNNSVTSVGIVSRGHHYHTSDHTLLHVADGNAHQKLLNTSPSYNGGGGVNISTTTTSSINHFNNISNNITESSHSTIQMQRDSPSTSTVDYSVDDEQSRPIMGHPSELSSPKDQPSNNDHTLKFSQESFPYIWKVDEFKRSVFYDFVHDYELKRARVYLLKHFPYYDPRLIEFNCKLFGVQEDQSSRDRNYDLQKILLAFDEIQFMLYLHVGRKRDALGIITSMINCGLICETTSNESTTTNSLLHKYNSLLFDHSNNVAEKFIPEESITKLKELTEQFFNKYGVEEEHDYTPLSIKMQSLEQKRKLEQESEDESGDDDSDCSIYILSESEDEKTPRLRYYNNCYQNYIPEIYYQPTNNSSPVSNVGVTESACFEMGGMSKHGTLMTDSSFSPSIIGELSKKKKKKKTSSAISSSSSKDSDRTGSSSDSQEDDDYMPSINGGISKKAKLKKKRRSNAKRACYHCRRSHLRCDNLRPCSRCTARGLDCYDMEQ